MAPDVHARRFLAVDAVGVIGEFGGQFSGFIDGERPNAGRTERLDIGWKGEQTR